MERKLPDTHKWISRHAKKRKKKGWAVGGIVGKSKEWGGEGWERIETDTEGTIHIRCTYIKEKTETTNIIVIYNSTHRNDIGKTRKLTEGYENKGIIIGGDFNIRIGELGEEEEGGIARKSKDKTIGNGGRKLIEIMQERDLMF